MEHPMNESFHTENIPSVDSWIIILLILSLVSCMCMDESGSGQVKLINFLPTTQRHKNSHIIFGDGRIKNNWLFGDYISKLEPSKDWASDIGPDSFNLHMLILTSLGSRSGESRLQWGRGGVRGPGGGRDRGGRGGVFHDAGAQAWAQYNIWVQWPMIWTFDK